MTTKHTLTLSEKIQLIRENEEKVSYRTLADRYKISIGSVSNIIKRKVEYIDSYEQNESSTKKRNLRDEFSQQHDQQVYEWFVIQRSKNIPVSGPLLQERARQIRQQLGGTAASDFKASNGWLQKFRIRHSIQHRVICGESAAVDPKTVDEWKKRLPSIIEQYDPNDVYNADETGLFFKALPDRSLVMAKEACKGGKRSKERFTVLLCTNMTGTDKLKPLLIGKAAKPRCFKHLNIKQLPVTWRSNRTSWMTASLFDDWLVCVNQIMIKQKRKILLFIDNAPCHNADIEYSNISLKLFPPNTTSELQPLDQGIIKNFKCYYRQYLVKHVISRCAIATSSDDIIIEALDAVHWTKRAWQAVTQSTIGNTFRTAGCVCSTIKNVANTTINSDSDSEEEILTNDISTALQNLDLLLVHLNIGGQSLSAIEFIEVDEDTSAFNEWNDVDNSLIIVDEQRHNNDDNDEDDDMPTETPPKVIEAMEMVRRLHLLAATQQPQLHSLISQLDSQLTQLFIDSKGVKQTTIDDFFHRN
ncbi:unnamed protein product [Rotaria magnacalcarata]|uniref:HTH CENPB-type domain-containing protein n=2 Tax=Rotaria magnacalcarata TaxID=392030 RepID=A0A816Z6X5_9BILA|nr:unnamed protein product [Rotaria magnacalcarata]